MTSNLSILIAADVDPSNVIGGAERALHGQLVELCKRGHRITVLCRQDAGKPTRETSQDGFSIMRYPMSPGTGPADLLRTLGSVKRAMLAGVATANPDLIYIQQPLAGAGALRAVGSQIPAAYQFHSPWSDEYRLRLPRASRHALDPSAVKLTPVEEVKLNLRRVIERSALRRSRKILTLSKFMRDRCIALHALDPGKFEIVPGGVDVGHFTSDIDREAFRARLGIVPNTRMLLSVRNLEPRMGLGNLIEAMPQIVASHPDTICIIGGSGQLAAELKEQASRLGLSDRVRFEGFIAEELLPKYYAASDLFVLPTTALEGFGMVTVEALACGTPVAGTQIGATPEILEDLDPALIIRGSDPSGIARVVTSHLARDVSSIATLRARCRAYAQDRYSWQSVVDGIENSLRGVANVGR